jgi:hypothetical protein
MNAVVLKGLLALLAAGMFLTVSMAIFLTRRGLPAALQALGIGCFGVMALTHVFEAFSILPAFGWGQPHTMGHLIDLVAALLGVMCVTTSFLLWRRDQRRSKLRAHGTVAPSNNRWRGP